MLLGLSDADCQSAALHYRQLLETGAQIKLADGRGDDRNRGESCDRGRSTRERNNMMHLTLMTLVLLSLIGGGLRAAPGVPAQDATPAVEEAALTIEPLGSAPAADAPGMTLLLLRATIAPGAGLPPHVHPGQLIVAVESGTAAYTIVSEQGAAGRGRAGTPTATEVILPGTEVLLEPGEWIIEEPGVVHAAHNPGDEPLVLLVSGLVASDEPFLQPIEMATPAA
jgi:quercetin dioxygenase-like cupin family protein